MTESGWTRSILGFKVYRSDLSNYMSRWIFEHPLGAVRLHYIQRPDMDVELHDHPWWFFSFILKGWYKEERPKWTLLRYWRNDIADAARGRSSTVCDTIRAQLAPIETGAPERILGRDIVSRQRFSFAFRRAEDPHRIIEVAPGGVWTLVITGPRVRPWGFWARDGWVYWQDFPSLKNPPLKDLP